MHSFATHFFPPASKWYPSLQLSQISSDSNSHESSCFGTPFSHKQMSLTHCSWTMWNPGLHALHLLPPWLVHSAPSTGTPFKQVHSMPPHEPSLWSCKSPLQSTHFISPWSGQYSPTAAFPELHVHTFSMHALVSSSTCQNSSQDAQTSLSCFRQLGSPGSGSLPFLHQHTLGLQMWSNGSTWKLLPQLLQMLALSLVQAGPIAGSPSLQVQMFSWHLTSCENASVVMWKPWVHWAQMCALFKTQALPSAASPFSHSHVLATHWASTFW
mmetsp:Transcript_86368/g.249444  ORF Transcript_86368/g.249444 Transcript_86368/m.249444 type:complete len:269 (-) Transcript_86368:722-1528(-)